MMLLALAGCGGSDHSISPAYRVVPLNTPFALQYSQTVRLQDDERTEVAVSVTEDRRAEGGKAVARIELREGPVAFGTTGDFRAPEVVFLSPGSATETMSLSARPSYWIQLVSLTPDAAPRNLSAYTFTLQVRRRVIE